MPMTVSVGATRLPTRARYDRAQRFLTMSNSDKERGEKRGVLDTGRAKDQTKDADADADNDEG